MVHGLTTIRRLNDEAVRRAGRRKPAEKPGLPKGLGLSPAALRSFTNRPWTKKELGDQPCVYESYARSAREQFEGKGRTEGPRP